MTNERRVPFDELVAELRTVAPGQVTTVSYNVLLFALQCGIDIIDDYAEMYTLQAVIRDHGTPAQKQRLKESIIAGRRFKGSIDQVKAFSNAADAAGHTLFDYTDDGYNASIIARPRPAATPDPDKFAEAGGKKVRGAPDTQEMYHITPTENVPKILKEGLQPQVGARGAKIGETKGIHLFPNTDSADDALSGWLGDEFDEDEPLSMLKVQVPKNAKSLPGAAGYEHIHGEPIKPANISVHRANADVPEESTKPEAFAEAGGKFVGKQPMESTTPVSDKLVQEFGTTARQVSAVDAAGKQNAPAGYITPEGKFEPLKKGEVHMDAAHRLMGYGDPKKSLNVDAYDEALAAGYIRKAGQGSYEISGELKPAAKKALEQDLLLDSRDIKTGGRYKRPAKVAIDDQNGNFHEFSIQDFIEKHNGSLDRAMGPKPEAFTEAGSADPIEDLIMSDKATAFIKSLLDKIIQRPIIAAQRAAEAEAAAPCPSGRVIITGRVLAVKVQERPAHYRGDDGMSTKLLVQGLTGFKVWGNQFMNAQKGDLITFTATIEPSEKDPKFGFFSRPTKGFFVNETTRWTNFGQDLQGCMKKHRQRIP